MFHLLVVGLHPPAPSPPHQALHQPPLSAQCHHQLLPLVSLDVDQQLQYGFCISARLGTQGHTSFESSRSAQFVPC